MRLRRGWVLLGAVAWACAPGDPLATEDGGPVAREPDGLLESPSLQRIVEAGLRRDATSLVAALEDPDARVRARAAFALGSVQDPLAGGALVALLADADPRVRADAAFALGQLPGDAFGTPLFDALKSEWYPSVQIALLEALGRHCDETAARRLRSIQVPALRGDVTRAVGRCALGEGGDVDAWAFLADRLTDPDPGVRVWAAYPFGRAPEARSWSAHLETVRRALDSARGDEPSAGHLIRALGGAADPADGDRIARWIRYGSDWRARANAVAALGQIAPEPPWAVLTDALEDPSAHVRIQAAQALRGAALVRPREFGAVAGEGVAGWIRDHPSESAVAASLLEALAAAGQVEAVEEWIVAAAGSGGDDGVWLAGLRGAAAVDGAPGLALLERVAEGAPPRPARRAVAILGQRRERASRPEGIEDPGEGGAGRGEGEGGARQNREAGTPYRAVDWEVLRELGPAPRLHLETSRGRIRIRLVPEEAPLTVDAIAATARAGRFDGVPFHRVVPNFVAQGGDVSRGGVADGAGFRLRSEFTRIRYDRGVLGMASAGKDTETTQFFLTHSAQPHLDGRYTAFGWVEAGAAVVDALQPEDVVVRARVHAGGSSRN
jgi:peptidylprolyl isomerase